MTFGQFNRHFRPNRTDCDWLSRDPQQVDRYRADPLCGFECSAGLWHDFITGMLGINPGQWPQDLPVHLFAGTDDPVAGWARVTARTSGPSAEPASRRWPSGRLTEGATGCWME